MGHRRLHKSAAPVFQQPKEDIVHRDGVPHGVEVRHDQQQDRGHRHAGNHASSTNFCLRRWVVVINKFFLMCCLNNRIHIAEKF